MGDEENNTVSWGNLLGRSRELTLHLRKICLREVENYSVLGENCLGEVENNSVSWENLPGRGSK